MSSTCHFCAREIGHAVVRATGDLDRCTINGPHWTGTEYVRVDMCGGCQAARKPAQAPRKPRQRREPAVYAGDWNMLVAFTGGGRGR